MVLPVGTVDCCFSSLQAGVCSLLWQWPFSARVLMVACLPLLRACTLDAYCIDRFPVHHGLF